MTLTEQWKKGELPRGQYWVKEKGGKIAEWEIGGEGIIIETKPKIDEVLAPVPSYEEYSRLEWYAGCGPDRIVELNKENRQLRKWCEEFNALEVAKENQQLKDVISKMCMELVDPDDDMSNGLAEYFNQDLLLEIHEVLK